MQALHAVVNCCVVRSHVEYFPYLNSSISYSIISHFLSPYLFIIDTYQPYFKSVLKVIFHNIYLSNTKFILLRNRKRAKDTTWIFKLISKRHNDNVMAETTSYYKRNSTLHSIQFIDCSEKFSSFHSFSEFFRQCDAVAFFGNDYKGGC